MRVVLDRQHRKKNNSMIRLITAILILLHLRGGCFDDYQKGFRLVYMIYVERMEEDHSLPPGCL